ncbi:arylamine N-acetyltransferase family protein [Aurantiacibacter zhengii]|uniref:Arylamine N-acetyltransferase n=1 Tax=Aurantiacibacter zhengii TaxID=2307003 RepID=A0A418NP17_9SPHN|nr:arylamine N-acetyltransferase [Aurantiacibacter zhengii]RIV83908.1 arylamine N-acetyltransferase [Aurantiacibacter zhengii]
MSTQQKPSEPQKSAYLARIGLSEPPETGPAGLAMVQAAHRRSIPFENLDVRLGRGIACDTSSAFAKLVTAKRGGYCFEHNRLLADMLSALGFANRLLLARVLLGSPPAPTPRTHCLVLVDFAGEQWIADAGFGGAYAPPMLLADGARAMSGDGAEHRLTRIGSDGDLPGSWLLERKGPRLATDGRAASDDAWEPQFAFDTAQVADADLALGNHWAATHPTSRFTNATVISLCLPDGFTSLVDRKLTVWRMGHDAERLTLETPAQYAAVLQERFGLSLDSAEIGRLALF